jgi:hypothetical protein
MNKTPFVAFCFIIYHEVLNKILLIGVSIQLAQVFPYDIEFKVDNSSCFKCVEVRHFVCKRNYGHLKGIFF